MPAKTAQKGNTLLTVLLVIVMLVGVVAGVLLLQERQNLTTDAAVPGGAATVSLTPATGSFNVGDSLQMSVFFNTADIPVSGVAVRLKYPFSGTSPELAVNAIEVNPSFLNSPDWTCPTVSSSEVGNEVVIDVACANTSATGFAAGSDTLLTQITLQVNSIPSTNPFSVVFDPTLSVITQKTNGQDILAIPVNQGDYTITGGDPTATVTPTESAGLTATASPTSTATPTPTTTGTGTSTPTPTTGGSTTTTVTTTATTTATATSTPAELIDAGISTPTFLGLAFGFLVLLLSFALFAL